jgi:hypothetical protein
MSQINLQGLINNISEKTTIYSPIIEAIVNSIQAIEESKRTDGVINIIVKRDGQTALELDDNSLPKIKSIEIYDNGIGFTNKNRDSFDTLYSDKKVNLGGKGFGRFIFLKYFEKVQVDSDYKESEHFFHRSFAFSSKGKSVKDLIESEKIDKRDTKEAETTICLENIYDKYDNQLDKKLETIARKIVEKLLPYFINEGYKCPKIILEEANNNSKIILNSYFQDFDDIKQIANKEFELKNGNKTEKFEVKIFKIYYTKSSSSVILTANNRAVTIEPLYEYVPEFKDDFFEKIHVSDKDAINKNYSIKAYVLGNYLNKHVSLERDDFAFSQEASLLFPFSRKEIETQAIQLVVDEFKEEVESRQKKKLERVKKYVDEQAPWHKSYFNELDLSAIPYNFDDVQLEGELQKLKYKKETSVRKKVAEILKQDDKKLSENIESISRELTELGKSDLAHYIVLRKCVLEVLNKSLKLNDDKKYEKEKIIHDLIFPMSSDSDHLSYDEHNLWIIDEKLSFHEYIASDKSLKGNADRPDLLIFDKPIAVRQGEELFNPINIFEFKRPQREEYSDDEDPIGQILRYIDKIRKGEFKDIDGRTIKATENTPAYGFLICDITEKIKEFCKKYSLTISPDNEGYFGFQTGYQVYLEVISFDKLIKDAELRNKIFFKKLNIV